jgi:hypothetical protein
MRRNEGAHIGFSSQRWLADVLSQTIFVCVLPALRTNCHSENTLVRLSVWLKWPQNFHKKHTYLMIFEELCCDYTGSETIHWFWRTTLSWLVNSGACIGRIDIVRAPSAHPARTTGCYFWSYPYVWLFPYRKRETFPSHFPTKQRIY